MFLLNCYYVNNYKYKSETLLPPFLPHPGVLMRMVEIPQLEASQSPVEKDRYCFVEMTYHIKFFLLGFFGFKNFCFEIPNFKLLRCIVQI